MTLKPMGKNLEAGGKYGGLGVEISQILPQEAGKVPCICVPRFLCKCHFSAGGIGKVYPNKHGFLMVPRYILVSKINKFSPV